MEAIKKQATKLREQVAKQQQHFQRDIVRGVEGYISTSKKQVEIARKLVDNCYKYGSEIQNGPSTLPKVAVEFGTTHAAMEDQREIMLGVLGSQVCEPLRASIHGAPLEDARHLTHSYDRMRQEFESQATEVIRRQSKFREASTESLAKLKNAETRLSELKSSVLVLGKEATDAMLSVEEEQQQITFQKLLTMVMHSFDAQADGELSLEVGDYVVVRQVAPNGWSEGECNGKSGWFPSAYAVMSDEVAASKMVETDTTP